MSNQPFSESCALTWLRHGGVWVVILLLAAGVRFSRLDWAALWYDEAYSWIMSTHPLADIWSISSTDVHPPLYYFVLKGWAALFGNGVTAIRALSASAGVLTVGLGMWLTRRVATRRAAVFAGVLLIILPISVRYSHEVRMYALVALWMTGATLALVYWVQTARHRYLVIYALLIAIGLYTHYFAIAGIVAHWLFVLTLRQRAGDSRRRRIFRPAWWIANLGAALLFLPWLPMFFTQLGRSSNLGWIKPVTLTSLPSVLWQYLTLDNGADLPTAALWAPVVVIIAICWFCLSRDKRPERLNLLLVMYLWVPLLVMLLVSLVLPLFVARYFLFSALALPMLLGISLDGLARTHRTLAVTALAALLAIEMTGIRNLYGEYDITNADGRKTQERINEIAELIDRDYRPGDQVIVLNYFWYPSMDFYTLRSARPLLYAPAPRNDGTDCVMYCRFEAPFGPGREASYIESLSHLPVDILRVWLVDGVDSTDDQLSLPCAWRLLDTQARGDNRLRLYDVNAAQTANGAKNCAVP